MRYHCHRKPKKFLASVTPGAVVVSTTRGHRSFRFYEETTEHVRLEVIEDATYLDAPLSDRSSSGCGMSLPNGTLPPSVRLCQVSLLLYCSWGLGMLEWIGMGLPSVREASRTKFLLKVTPPVPGTSGDENTEV